ncbi:MAG: hypothetical protein R2707_16450 [Acidimicrobiales bacterium]
MRRDPIGPGLPERIVSSLFVLLAVLLGVRLLAGLLDPLLMPLFGAAAASAILLWFWRRLYF